MSVYCSEFQKELEFFIEIDGKVVTQPVNPTEVATALVGVTTSTGEPFSVVTTAETGIASYLI